MASRSMCAGVSSPSCLSNSTRVLAACALDRTETLCVTTEPIFLRAVATVVLSSVLRRRVAILDPRDLVVTTILDNNLIGVIDVTGIGSIIEYCIDHLA